jgi:DNA-binding transcriptional regulator PaaX
MRWVLVIVRVPAEPTRHRVAIWRELRRTGAIQLAAAVWAFPARPAFEEALQRVMELADRAEGEIIRLHATGADDVQAAKLEGAYTAERDAEWSEFLSDCDKYLAELDREIAIEKFTRAELEEEEQSMERLRRWHRELALRDIFGARSAPVAERRLKDCEAKLDDYTERVFNALHAT